MSDHAFWEINRMNSKYTMCQERDNLKSQDLKPSVTVLQKKILKFGNFKLAKNEIHVF